MKGEARKILEDLRQARVLVIHPRDEDAATLVDHLKRLGCEVKAAWPMPAVLPKDVDTVFLQVESLSTDGVTMLLADRNPAIIAIVTYESPIALKAIIDLNAHGVISKPIRPLGVLTQFALARYRWGFEGRLTTKVAKLEDTLKGRRTVDKAVKILAELNHVDEEAAYRMLRDQATAQRQQMVAIAETVISAQEAMRSLGLTIAPSPRN
jgi:AmiR/NasT family two-component response regulator